MQRRFAIETFRFARPFTIARGTSLERQIVTATLTHEGATGRADCTPYARYGETPEGVLATLEALPERVGRATLPALLPAGAARNVMDCALWDWEAKRRGVPVWKLAGLVLPVPMTTAQTVSLGTPEAMEAEARGYIGAPLLKVKLGTAEDMPRLEAVRRGAPAARLIVDANEGWTVSLYAELAPHLARLGVELVEQPLPAGEDGALSEIARPVPVCADESCHDRESLGALKGRYDAINIKLDKTGGLTEALALRDAARALGLRVMVGCMAAPSRAMAPAMLVAQGADWVDLDGPVLLAEDEEPRLRYETGVLHPADPALWG